MLDFDRDIIEAIQLIRSHEVEQVQIADLLTGAVGYANRGLTSSEAKSALVDRIKQRSKYTLLRTTLLSESRFNLFQWSGGYGARNRGNGLSYRLASRPCRVQSIQRQLGALLRCTVRCFRTRLHSRESRFSVSAASASKEARVTRKAVWLLAPDLRRRNRGRPHYRSSPMRAD